VLTIRDYQDDLAADFHDINVEWISAMFALERADREVLENPREHIIEPGGAILFVEAEGLGVIGTCALRKTGEYSFELTKMAVRERARGMKAGEFLLAAAIERAKAMQAEPLYLLTNARCAAAIHLYEKLGFEHDAAIMALHGARYQRCDVAMRYRGWTGRGAAHYSGGWQTPLGSGAMDFRHMAVAIVPCSDLDSSQAFYERLGFRATANYPHHGYRILHDGGGASIHLTGVAPGSVDPERNAHGVYFYAEEVEALAAAMGCGAEHKPWGLVEFAVSDPDGTLVRIGWPKDGRGQSQ